ncbi:MAG: dTMP kinase [Desulfopila sp.]
MQKGCLIVFEGIDGTGKSTQLQLLASHLTQQGLSVVATKEPTNGGYGKKIRQLYSDRQQMSITEELALFVEDRREHVNNVIEPALEAHKIILCDRYFLSTIAYQGAAGADPQEIARLNDFAPRPDLAFIFEADPQSSTKRITEQRGDSLNDFEQLETLQRVAAQFSALQQSYIRRIDALQPVDTIHREVAFHAEGLIHNLKPLS